METVSLLEFARSGRFGPVEIGVTREVVETCFGPPEGVGGRSRRDPVPLIWKYGDVQFTFEPRGGLYLAFVDLDGMLEGVPRGWGGLKIEPWVICSGLSQSALLESLAEAEISYAVRTKPKVELNVVTTAAGVEFGFPIGDSSEDVPGRLAYIAKSP